MQTSAPNPTPAASSAEPKAVRDSVPTWLVVLLLVLLYWAMEFFDEHGGWSFSAVVYTPYRSVAQVEEYQPKVLATPYDRGKIIYEGNCALCHNTDGTGKPNQAPPFAGSDWALGSANRMIRIPQYGLNGPIDVKGTPWNLSMAAMGAGLSNEDLAAVLTYIRQSWGNKASTVTPEQVKAVRAEVGNRSQPWTADELKNIQ